MTGLTQSLARFVSELRPEHIPAEAFAVAERGTLDTIGVMFAGRDEPVVRLTAATLASVDERGEARVLGDRGRASAADAALINSVAGHALDYDDVALDGHPSVVLAPVVLAEGERLGRSGREVLAAYVAGYETWAEFVMREPDKLHGKGWHPTAVLGVVGCAAAAASLARLDAARTAHALAIAASMAAGVIANFGTMTKPLQAGLAARNGLQAARLAAAGITAAPDALEHHKGFLAALSPQGRVRLDGPAEAGERWRILEQGLNIKRYPACYAVHRSIDASLSVREKLAGRLADIERIDVEIGPLQAGMLRNPNPQTGLDAKFSAQFAVASALIDGHVGLGQFTDSHVTSPPIRDLIAKVRVLPTDTADPDEPLFGLWDRVTVHLRGGEAVRAEPVYHPKGHAKRPLTMEELEVKFLDCARVSMDDASARAWWRGGRQFVERGFAALPDTMPAAA